MYMVASCMSLSGHLVYNPSIFPDWESNQRPFASQCGAQSTEPHQPGLNIIFTIRKHLKGYKTLGEGCFVFAL